MKKKILGLAVIAMSLIALPSVAQNKNNDGRKKEARIENTQCTKDAKTCDSKKVERACCLFEGITLSDTQKDQLKQLNDKQKADRKARGEARRADKQRNDSTMRAQRRASKKAYLEEVKAIVGPDQYVVFLENFYLNGGQGNGHGKAIKGQKNGHKNHGNIARNGKGRHDKAMNRADRGNKAAKAGKAADGANAAS